GDGTALVWDLSKLNTSARPLAKELDAKHLESLWTDLGTDAGRADRAIWNFVGVPTQTIAFLHGKLHPVTPLDPTRLPRLVANLDADAFADRERATRKLKKITVATVSESERFLVVSELERALGSKSTLEARRRIEEILPALKQSLPDHLSVEELR